MTSLPTPTPIALSFRNVEKTFKRRHSTGGHTTLKSQFLRALLGRPRPPSVTGGERTLTVLRDISFEVPRGTTLGVVGQNGSGKSTLLKLIAGIYRPTAGEVRIEGRISALIELGAGFHPEFSGRENVYINGIILGRTRRQIDGLMDAIIDFAELREFIDEPVRTYSSGMYMRLAFSVATHVDPDVLIIDEILAVGDEHFQRKSRRRIEEFQAAGKTIVLVTHDAGAVQSFCNLAVWIDDGRVAATGSPAEVVAKYQAAVRAREAAGTSSAGPLAAASRASGI